MASTGDAAAPDLISADIDPQKYRPNASRTLIRGAWMITVVVAIAILVPYIAVQLQRSEVVAGFERRLQILADGRGDVIATWLDGMTRPADRVVGSELFRLGCANDLEGIVAKPKLSPYRSDSRQTTWIKIKNPAYSQNQGRRELFNSFRRNG